MTWSPATSCVVHVFRGTRAELLAGKGKHFVELRWPHLAPFTEAELARIDELLAAWPKGTA